MLKNWPSHAVQCLRCPTGCLVLVAGANHLVCDVFTDNPDAQSASCNDCHVAAVMTTCQGVCGALDKSCHDAINLLLAGSLDSEHSCQHGGSAAGCAEFTGVQ